MDDEMAGLTAAWNWTKRHITQDQVVADYEAHNSSKEWYAGWMKGIGIHYFEPFEHEKDK